MRRLLPCLLVAAPLAACHPPAAPQPSAKARPLPLVTRADTLARAAYDAMGGPQVWERVRFLRFDFGPEQNGRPSPSRRRHLWDRTTGDYRLEVGRGDSLYVVLFNTQTKAGQAFQSPSRTDTAAFAPVPSERQQGWIDRAYRAFINDTYWLLQPTKLFDPGVVRSYAADSSGSGRQVLALAFAGVGLTPGDRYWLYFDAGRALPSAWRFHLQGDAAAGPLIRSSGDTTLRTPYGPATLRRRHAMPGRTILTDAVALPAAVDPRLFTTARVRLD